MLSPKAGGESYTSIMGNQYRNKTLANTINLNTDRLDNMLKSIKEEQEMKKFKQSFSHISRSHVYGRSPNVRNEEVEQSDDPLGKIFELDHTAKQYKKQFSVRLQEVWEETQRQTKPYKYDTLITE